MLQTASVLQYPVFVNGENYNGRPSLLGSPLLRSMLVDHFAGLTEELPNAVYLPLGPVAANAMAWLVAQGYVPRELVLEGLPHPAGPNSERVSYFLGRKPKEALSTRTNADKLDSAKRRLEESVRGLPAWQGRSA